MAKNPKADTLSMRSAHNFDAVCRLPRDRYGRANWSIMTDGERVWISKQKMGENRTSYIEVPKKIFDFLFDQYGKPRACVR